MSKLKKKSKLQKNKEDVHSQYWMRKCYRLWSITIRNYSDYKCTICGSDRFTQAHHLLPKEAYFLHSFNPRVGITLCSACHKFGKRSAHKNALWFADWLKTNRPEQYGWCMRRIEEFSSRPKKKVDWPDLKAVFDNLNKFNFKDLNWDN